MLSVILSGQPYKPLGAPPALTRSEVTNISREAGTQVGINDLVYNNGELTLASGCSHREDPRTNYTGSHNLGVL